MTTHDNPLVVRFSETDLGSHERGYPALLDISGQSVGALVLATQAVAGDIWLDTGGRTELEVATVIGPNIVRATPSREAVPSHREQDDRQARVFGGRGQAILRRAKVGVMDAGGGGMLAVEYLARLGAAGLVVIDPDRVDLTNLPRLPGATRFDAMAGLTSTSRPAWLRRLGVRLAAPKVRVTKRLADSAGQGTRVTTIRRSAQHPAAVNALLNCDYIVLAADSAIARHITNIISHQYLVPMVQVGVKVPVDDDGAVGDLFAATRMVLPDRGCLRCAELIDRDETGHRVATPAERRRGRLRDWATCAECHHPQRYRRERGHHLRDVRPHRTQPANRPNPYTPPRPPRCTQDRRTPRVTHTAWFVGNRATSRSATSYQFRPRPAADERRVHSLSPA